MLENTPLRMVVAFAAIFIILGGPSEADSPTAACAAVASECSCQGTRARIPSRGGDSSPLTWSSVPYLESELQPGFPIHCFDSSVKNHSAAQTTDVHWRVAEFYRNRISPGCVRSNCVSVEDQIDPIRKAGPLHYGPGSDLYSTDVYTPARGWPNQKRRWTFDFMSGEDVSNFPELRSEFTFEIEHPDMGVTASTFSVRSRMQSSDRGYYVIYTFRNDGPGSIHIHANMTKFKGAYRNYPFSYQKPLTIPAGQNREFEIPINGPVIIEPTLITIWDNTGEILSISRAGLYAAAYGNKDRADEEIWSEIN